MSKVMTDIEGFINFDKFNKIVNLANSLPNSTGDIELNYIDDRLVINIASNRGNSNFTFNIDKTIDTLSNKSILLRAAVLRRLLNSFNSVDKIGLAISNTGLTLEYKNIKAIMMHITN